MSVNNKLRCFQSFSLLSKHTKIEGFSISIRGMSHIADGISCEDYCTINVLDNCSVYVVADGHSCSCDSEYGSKAAVDALVNLLQSYEREKLTESDLIRFCHNRKFFSDLLDLWVDFICQHVSISREEYNLKSQDEKYSFVYPFGTTLLAAIVCENIIICFSVGDGGFLLLHKDRNSDLDIMQFSDSSDFGDIVSTSMCDLNKEVFSVSIHSRNIYDGLFIMSDGCEGPWIESDIFQQLNEQRKSRSSEEMRNLLYHFVVEKTHPIERDDISLVFGNFQEVENGN